MPRFLAVTLVAALLASTSASAASALKFAPHQAIYDLRLDQNRPNSQVLRADGKLTFTLADACEGWTTDQKLEIKFFYAQGQQATIIVTTSSWEAKDGTTYSFSSRTTNNGQESEVFRGKANLTDKGGEAIYTQPKGKKVKILPGAIFPNQHSIAILQHALAGEKVPNMLVFDGTDEKAQSDVSVYLGKSLALADDKTVPPALRADPLLQGIAYPSHLAFFALPEEKSTKPLSSEAESGTPDYELKIDLLPNSIARKILIDYGNFTVRGTISALKPLPDAGCVAP